jgi:hypothetical protein
MNLWRVAASPSIDYEAHTFDCAGCNFRYTARIETPLAIRAFRLGQVLPAVGRASFFADDILDRAVEPFDEGIDASILIDESIVKREVQPDLVVVDRDVCGPKRR